MEVKHWYYDRCWWKKKYFKAFFAVWTSPFFQHIPGKSFRLKFLMYVWNRTHKATKKLQKHFRWTVWRSNIDILIDADEKKKLRHFCLAPEGKRDIGGGLSVCPSVCLSCVCRPPGKSFRLKFLMYVWNTFRGQPKATKTLQMDSMEVKHWYYDRCWLMKKILF